MCHSEGSFLGRFWRRAKSKGGRSSGAPTVFLFAGVFGAAEEAFRPSAAREHGNFDSLGRDAVRTIGAFARRAGLVPDGSSDGLDVKNRTFFGNAAEKFKESVRAIYPGERRTKCRVFPLLSGSFEGTLWCGDGTRAKSREELGLFKDTDACCREHDECPDGMPAGSEKYGLENTGLFTRCLKILCLKVRFESALRIFHFFSFRRGRQGKPRIYVFQISL